MRCRETAGILFKTRCEDAPTGQCSTCQKPVCNRHQRWQGQVIVCVSCLRDSAKDPYKRHSLAHLRDDPYFFWFYRGGPMKDPYGEEDYRLFDDEEADFGSDAPDEWYGS